jgi:signal transduction histidine kinase
MSRLVDGLLVLARNDAGPLMSEPIDVAAVVRARGDAWTDAAADREVQLIVDTAGEAWANVTPGGAEQFVDNLVDNALAVSSPGDAVTLRVALDGPRVEVHVVDSGPGLDGEARLHAFDRFWRAPDAPSGGSGLGLSIVRRIAEASGGSARLDDAPGGGIDAVVSLIAARPQSQSPPAARSAPSADDAPMRV